MGGLRALGGGRRCGWRTVGRHRRVGDPVAELDPVDQLEVLDELQGGEERGPTMRTGEHLGIYREIEKRYYQQVIQILPLCLVNFY